MKIICLKIGNNWFIGLSEGEILEYASRYFEYDSLRLFLVEHGGYELVSDKELDELVYYPDIDEESCHSFAEEIKKRLDFNEGNFLPQYLATDVAYM